MVITLFFPYRQEKGVPGHSLSRRYQMTNKRAKCLLINQQTVLHIAQRTPKEINHSNLHASSTVMTFKSFSSKSFTFLVTR